MHGRNLMLAGVPTTSLRREVINRMIRENGWVVNDYQKEIGGRRFTLSSRSRKVPADASSPVCSTSLKPTDASTASRPIANADSAERLAEESEKVIILASEPPTSGSASIDQGINPPRKSKGRCLKPQQPATSFNKVMSIEQENQSRIADHAARTSQEDDGCGRL